MATELREAAPSVAPAAGQKAASGVAALHPGTLQIPSLDGMRAVAFLIVFVSHAGYQTAIPGGFGVTIFFFLSGYLITTLLRQEQTKHGAISLRLFYARRLLRIWPPFYIVLLLAIGATLAGILTMQLQKAALLSLFLHVTNYRTMYHGLDGAPPGTLVYWSLAVEEHFYLLFPWLMIGLYRLKWTGRQQAILLWSICAVVMLWRIILVYGLHSVPHRTYMGTDTRVDSLLFGCALALWGNPALDPTEYSARTWRNIFLPLGLLLLLSTFLIRGDGFRESIRYTMQGIGLIPVFVAAIRYPTWAFFQALNWSWMRWMGIWSYSLYLLHYCVIHAVQDNLPFAKIPAAILSLAITILLAYAMYRLVEKPCARVRKRLSRA